MAIKTIKAIKHPLPMPQLHLVKGDSKTQKLLFKIDKDDGGIDLSGLLWSVKYKNAAGMGDITYIGSGTVDDDGIITVEWSVPALACGEAGETIFQVFGVDSADSTDEAWSSGIMVLHVSHDVGNITGDDADAVTEIHELVIIAKKRLDEIDGELDDLDQRVKDITEDLDEIDTHVEDCVAATSAANAAAETANTAATNADQNAALAKTAAEDAAGKAAAAQKAKEDADAATLKANEAASNAVAKATLCVTATERIEKLCVQNVDELPTANAENHLWMRAVNDNGTERLFINLLKDAVYHWFEFKQSSTSEDTAVLGSAVIGTLVLGKE